PPAVGHAHDLGMSIVTELGYSRKLAMGGLNSDEVSVRESEVVSCVWVKLHPRLGRQPAQRRDIATLLLEIGIALCADEVCQRIFLCHLGIADDGPLLLNVPGQWVIAVLFHDTRVDFD